MLSLPASARVARILRVRYSSSASRTRIVFDIKGRIERSNVKEYYKHGCLNILLRDSTAKYHVKRLRGFARWVKLIPLKYNRLLIRIKLNGLHKYKIFALKSSRRYRKPFRLVVDILPELVVRKKIVKHVPVRIVVIDPGHGGRDPGAVWPPRSRHPRIEEKWITLSIAKKVAYLLSKHGGIKVILTRRRDVYVPLLKRAEIAARDGADAFVSIHADSLPHHPRYGGITVFKASPALFAKAQNTAEEIAKKVRLCSDVMCWSISPVLVSLSSTVTFVESGRLARDIEKSLRVSTKHLSEMVGIRDMRRNILVLKTPGRPAVLIEVGFLTNRRDRRLLVKSWYQWKIARGIAKGIERYIDSLNRKREVFVKR